MNKPLSWKANRILGVIVMNPGVTSREISQALMSRTFNPLPNEIGCICRQMEIDGYIYSVKISNSDRRKRYYPVVKVEETEDRSE